MLFALSTKLKRSIELLKEIELLGPFEAYIVGGAVRDILMNRAVNDIDIATNCPIDVLQNHFRCYDIGKSKKFGVIVVQFGRRFYDVAQFRFDKSYIDGRHPEEIEILSDFREDVVRRDFTINALGINSKENIIDLVNGIEDLNSRIIRTVGNPYERFGEDSLRMMRAARFASLPGFSIEPLTRRAIRKLFRSINVVSPERIATELIKAAKRNGKSFAKFILILDDLKLLFQILPEVSNLKYFRHKLTHHPEGITVFDHVIESLKITGNMPWLSKIATLLHDVGKGVSFQDFGAYMSYSRHEKSGAVLSEQICHRLKFSEADTNAIIFAVKNHMKFHKILEMRPSKIARLVNSPYFDTLLDVARADEFSRGETFKHIGEFEESLKRIAEIKKKWENRVINFNIKLVDGKKIMELLNLKPGKLVGVIKRSIENRIIDEQLDPDDKKLMDKLILEEGKRII